MTSVPIFVRSGDDTVAAVVTVPTRSPDGLVIVLAGTGRHHVIGGTLAALLAERLATEGLATVRLDYAGVGDSPGVVASWTPADVGREANAARAAVTAVAETLGVSRFAGVGTCFGSRVALQLLSDPRCIGTVCLAPPILDPGSTAMARRAFGKRRLVGALRSIPLASRLLKPLGRRLVPRAPSARVLESLSHLDRARVVFLYGSPREDDHYSARVLESVNGTLASLPEDDRARFELRLLEAGPLSIFDSLDAAARDEIVETVALEVRGCFASGKVPAGSAS